MDIENISVAEMEGFVARFDKLHGSEEAFVDSRDHLLALFPFEPLAQMRGQHLLLGHVLGHLAQPRERGRDRCVAFGHPALEYRAAALGRQGACLDDVLETDGQAIDGRGRSSRRVSCAGRIGRRSGTFEVEGDEGMHFALCLLYPFDQRIQVGARCQSAVPEGCCCAAERWRAACAGRIGGRA
jgi:hypothetical protein